MYFNHLIFSKRGSTLSKTPPQNDIERKTIPMKHLSGVYPTARKNGQPSYRASITIQRKHISLGSYAKEEQARAAYLEAKTLLASPQIQPEDYNSSSMLSFEKWVILMNVRDNGVYFRTPLYLKKEYVLYYYSPSLCLTFDLKDLPFYSSHKLTKRGSSFFASEGGKQFPLLSHYGIRSYAREGRDYFFVNGDSHDLRYDNISIVNRYYGVQKEYRKGMPVYTARIQIRGSIIIGRYSSEEEAAIAYNKAASYLKEHGVAKTYPKNVLPELDEIDYARIYHLIQLPKRFSKPFAIDTSHHQ